MLAKLLSARALAATSTPAMSPPANIGVRMMSPGCLSFAGDDSRAGFRLRHGGVRPHEERAEPLQIHGLAVEVALQFVAAVIPQEVTLGLGFDSLRHRLHAELVGEADDGLDDGGVSAVLGDAVHEGLVELEHVDGEA